ncbi:MAG TPA: UBP-type zinc finger domain-containing protein [Planctomycetota bacterium]|nr:UBP-type zinc finger domain-containing protein [Planctomycetota bacterium]
MTCHHMKGLEPVPARAEGCEECLASGSRWVHLRLCLGCGHVGCCDDSPNRHATKHFHSTRHPVIASFEPGERWGWCYVDEEQLEVPERFAPTLRA